MADKLNEFASKMAAGKGGPPGKIGLGVKLLAAGAAAAYGIQQSMYTGECFWSLTMYLLKISARESHFYNIVS